jgi:hypothetical protein
MLTVPAPGRIGSTNSFPAMMVLSPDGHYAALLNDGYGTQETMARQSISILNLDTNTITDFPDSRFSDLSHQSYFIGLAFSSDGKHLYASVGSLTDPTGAKQGDTGNGIAVYSFSAGKVAPERFIPIPLQRLSTGKMLAVGLMAPPHMAIPYPAGLALIAGSSNYVKPQATLDALIPGFAYFASWYVLGAIAFALIAMETRGRTIDEIDTELTVSARSERPKGAAA